MMPRTDDGFARYEDDPDFNVGVRVMRAATGTAADEVLASTAVLLLPPPSLATRRTPVALDWLDAHDFSVEYARTVRLSDDRIHRIWKYQIAGHDADRIRIMSQLLTCGPSLLLAVVGPVRGGVPVATRLCELKGKADPARTAPHHLRHRLGAANMFNNFVHTPDGPPELLREAAVMLPEQDLSPCGSAPAPRARVRWGVAATTRCPSLRRPACRQAPPWRTWPSRSAGTCSNGCGPRCPRPISRRRSA
jgi:hypothetical protein